MKTAIEKIGKSATGGKADIRQLTDALDTVDDGEAIRNLIEELKQAGMRLRILPRMWADCGKYKRCCLDADSRSAFCCRR